MKEPSNTDYFLKTVNADRSYVLDFYFKGSFSRVKKKTTNNPLQSYPVSHGSHVCCSRLPKENKTLQEQLELTPGLHQGLEQAISYYW